MYINLNKIIKSYEIKMQLRLLTGKAKNNSTIGPALSQYGIKGVELCNKFNIESLKIYKKNILVKVLILIYKDKTYQLYFEMPPLFFLFKLVSLDNIVSLRDLYKIALIKSYNIKNISLRLIFKNILNSLKNYNYKINV